MMQQHGVVAIVPARGGSKSVPRKNLRQLGGIPLLAYSIEAGLRASAVDRVIVSTNDPEIAEVARRYGADVPFLRPSELATDLALDLPVFQHALEWLAAHDDYRPVAVVQLRPTSPFRPPNLVDEAVALLQSDPETDSVRAVVRASQNPYKMWRLGSGGLMTPLIETAGIESYNQPRQALPVTHWQTGHIDVIRASAILERGSMSGRRIRGIEVDPAYSCDIDSEADWSHAEWLLSRFTRTLVRPGATPSRPER